MCRQPLPPAGLDAVLGRAAVVGEVTIQARKTYVSLLTPRRTFASVEPTTRSRIDLGLRWPTRPPMAGSCGPASMGNNAVTMRIALASADEVDDEVGGWLRRAYEENS